MSEELLGHRELLVSVFKNSEHKSGACYDPGIGIFGMYFYIVMGRPGVCMARRRQQKMKTPGMFKIFSCRFILFTNNYVLCVYRRLTFKDQFLP